MGVTKKGDIKGLACNLDKLQQDVANANQAVHSPPIISTNILEIDSKKIAVVQINRANDKNAHTYKGAVYVRIGSTTRKLEGQSLFDFLKNRQILCFDEQDSDAKIDDIDEKRVRLYLAKRNQENYLKTHSLKEFIVSNMLGRPNGEVKLKNVASLFFSKEPYKWHPQNEIRVVRFDGIQPVKIISQRDFKSDPFENIEQTTAFIRENISKRFVIPEESTRRIEVEEYLMSVIREAVINAVAHREYHSSDSIQINIFDDRIEINNPGGLPEGLTREFFGKRSVRRNPITYRLLRDCQYVEGLGIGIPKMINEMRKAGLKDPEFNFEGGFFVVTLKNAKSTIKPVEGLKDLNQRQLNAIEFLRQNKTLKSKNYASINNVSLPIALQDINELIKFKFLKKVGTYRGAYYILNEEKFK
jgi:ATP-dependent DNA helicase RecG